MGTHQFLIRLVAKWFVDYEVVFFKILTAKLFCLMCSIISECNHLWFPSPLQ